MQPLLTIAEAVRNANAHFTSGNLEPAGQLCQEILQIEPDNADALHLLSFICWHQNRKAEAIALLEQAVSVHADNADLINNLGGFYKEMGQLEAALNCFSLAISVDPTCFLAHHNLAVLLSQSNRLNEAVAAFEQALTLKPDLPPVYNNLGITLTALGRYDQARAVLLEAIALDNSYVDAYNNLGMVERRSGQLPAAIGWFEKAIALSAENPQLHKNLAETWSGLAQHRQAAVAYQRSLSLKQNDFDCYIGLAACYIHLSNGKEAALACSRAQELKPKSLLPLWLSCISCLPAVYSKVEEIETARQRYHDSLQDLESCLHLNSKEAIDDASQAVGATQPFYLASQGGNDRELQQKYGTIVHKIMSAKYPQWSQPLAMPQLLPGQKIKVGFVSRYFQQHANWKILLGGWAQGLDSKSFELFGYRTGGITDSITAKAAEIFDVFVEGRNFEELCLQIRADNLHVLIFPEIGMDPVTLKLAALRLAPVQCVSWGHPNTSGLPTIDYFLSSDLMEPDNAQEYYTENLVRLPNLSSYYIPQELNSDATKLESYGLRQDAITYLSVQALHKYLPQYDTIFPRIAARVPGAQFLLVSNPPGLDLKIKERLQQAFAAAGLSYEQHVTFLPFLNSQDFSALCSQGHVYLDTVEWSGCTTTLEALEQNLVPVTLPGKYMRSRHTSAMLSMMGISQTIAKSVDDYVDIAVRLGQDKNWRQELAQQISRRRYMLYRDPETIVALEDFLKSCLVVKDVSPEPRIKLH